MWLDWREVTYYFVKPIKVIFYNQKEGEKETNQERSDFYWYTDQSMTESGAEGELYDQTTCAEISLLQCAKRFSVCYNVPCRSHCDNDMCSKHDLQGPYK